MTKFKFKDRSLDFQALHADPSHRRAVWKDMS
jgi:hypothetical protein